jgi:hypothetical protein
MDNKKRKKNEEVYSKRIRAGKKRTYFIDVKTTRNDDYYITITESKRDFKNPNYYIKHKIFLYKEDFNKFVNALNETVDHVKTELLPDYEFDMFDKDDDDFFENETTTDLEEGSDVIGFDDESFDEKNQEDTDDDFKI